MTSSLTGYSVKNKKRLFQTGVRSLLKGVPGAVFLRFQYCFLTIFRKPSKLAETLLGIVFF